MYNFTLISEENFKFHSLIWKILTYVSFFNSSFHQVNFKGLFSQDLQYYKIEYNEFLFKCPQSTLIIDCKCVCDENIFGVEIATSFGCKCKSLTQLIPNCRIEIKCLEYFNNISIDTHNSRLNLSNLNTEFTCSSEINQFMSSCSYYILFNTTKSLIGDFKSKNLTLNGQGEINHQYKSIL